jgi:putative MATE family efflux protein
MRSEPKSRVLDKGLWGMSAPMLVDQAVIYTIPLLDMFFLSFVSDKAAAAVGAITPLIFVANALLFITAFAGAGVASQRIGTNDYQNANATIVVYASVVFVLGIVAALALIFGGPWVASQMPLSDEVEQYAHEYLSIIGWLVMLWGCRTIYQTIFNIYGEPKWNSVSNIIFFVCNLIGNCVAIFGFMGIPPSGVKGVALAGVISAFITFMFVMLVAHFRLRIRLPVKYAFNNFVRLLKPVGRIAAPSILEPMSFQGNMMALNWIAAQVSILTLTIKVYAYNTFLFCLMISIALSMATEAIIAQRVGRKEFDLADLQLRQSLKVAFIGTSVLALLWWLFNQQVLGLFSDDPEVLALGFWVFFWAMLSEPGRTANIVLGSALRSTGDATFTSLTSIAVIWLFSVPLAYVLAIPMGMGIYGLLIAAIADEMFRAAIKWWRWKQRKWEQYGVAVWEAKQKKRLESRS